MKHIFLLDENILYHAIKGVDQHENPDTTATEFVLLVARNCHRIWLNHELAARYWHHLSGLTRHHAPALEPVQFMTQFMKNSAKVHEGYGDPLELPTDVKVPAEDVIIVRAALLSNAVIVTADNELELAVNSQPKLGVRALKPRQAIELAKEE